MRRGPAPQVLGGTSTRGHSSRDRDPNLAGGGAGEAERGGPAITARLLRDAPPSHARLAGGQSTRAAEPMHPWIAEAAVLLRREWRLAKPTIEATYRPFIGSTAFLNVGMGLLGGTFFYRLGYEEADIFPRFTACFNGGAHPASYSVGVSSSSITMRSTTVCDTTRRLQRT